MQTRSPSPGEKTHASAAMVVIVYDDTADLTEKSSFDTMHMSSIATDEETQESNVRATTRRSSPVLALSYQTDDMEEINLAASASASGAVTSADPKAAASAVSFLSSAAAKAAAKAKAEREEKEKSKKDKKAKK